MAFQFPRALRFRRKLAPSITKMEKPSIVLSLPRFMRQLPRQRKLQGKKFGDPENPFLVSVRSGARASMPGMMDTILNLGLNDVAVEAVAKRTNNPRFAYDSYRRFIQMFSDVVMGIEKSKFEAILDAAKEAKGVKLDNELEAEDLKKVVANYKELYKKEMGVEFPPGCKRAADGSCQGCIPFVGQPQSNRIIAVSTISLESWGTAVNVQGYGIWQHGR